MRWQLYDPREEDTWVFTHNPSAMTSMAQGHDTTSMPASPIDGRVRALRTPDKPFEWSFSGKVRTSEQYDQWRDWSQRPNRLELTDHFGRVHEILTQQFLPTPVEKSGTGNDWLFAYTLKAIYYRRIL